MQNICIELVHKDGSIHKKSDYDIWGGLTTKGIPTNEVITVQVLHALRTVDHFIKTVVHLWAEVFNWPESLKIIHRESLNTHTKKEEIHYKILEETG